MAILLVAYELKDPGRNYQPVTDYLKQFAYCREMDSVWLIDTASTPEQVWDGLKRLVAINDRVFVTRLANGWASWNYPCHDWMNDPCRLW